MTTTRGGAFLGPPCGGNNLSPDSKASQTRRIQSRFVSTWVEGHNPGQVQRDSVPRQAHLVTPPPLLCNVFSVCDWKGVGWGGNILDI